MKQLYQFVCGACLLLPCLASCEKDLPIYDYPECGLEFPYEQARDSVYNYSFAFGPDDVVEDTVRFEVALIGTPTDYDRPITLKQVMTGKNDAEAGKHYVPFDDPSLASKYILPKNAISVEVPIVVKREASMKNTDYTLLVSFQPNEDFTFTSKERKQRAVTISDQLVKPNEWDNKASYHFGAWSRVKHQFMIDVTGYRWDNDFFANEMTAWLDGDQSILMGLQKQMQNALAEYEAEHGQMLDENGNPVEFSSSL